MVDGFTEGAGEKLATEGFLDLMTLEDGTYRLSRNVGNELPLYAA